MNKLFLLSALLFVLLDTVIPQTTIQVGTTYNFSQGARVLLGNIQYPGEFTIHIGNLLTTYDWGLDYDRMYVYNDSLKPIGRREFSSDADPFLFHMFQGSSGLTFRVGQAGTYYIDVHSGQPKDWGTATSQSYSLLVNAIYCNDVYEPNDDFTNAKPISFNTTYQACEWRTLDSTMNVSGDEDYYYFNAPSAGDYVLTMQNWIGIYDWGADFDRL